MIMTGDHDHQLEEPPPPPPPPEKPPLPENELPLLPKPDPLLPPEEFQNELPPEVFGSGSLAALMVPANVPRLKALKSATPSAPVANQAGGWSGRRPSSTSWAQIFCQRPARSKTMAHGR